MKNVFLAVTYYFTAFIVEVNLTSATGQTKENIFFI